MISNIHAREILDSRGNPTLEVELETEGPRLSVRASVPSGASRGAHEAMELRDSDSCRYNGMGLHNAIKKVEAVVLPTLKNLRVDDQQQIDDTLIALDGTDNKGHLGANLTLAISWAVAKAAANLLSLPLYAYLAGLFRGADKPKLFIPRPFINVINGGVHADNDLEIQEFMIVPSLKVEDFKETIRWASEIFHKLKALLKTYKFSCNVGDEGGFAPEISDPEHAIEIILQAIKEAGYEGQFSLALDVAASQFHRPDGKYAYRQNLLSSDELIALYSDLIDKFPIISIEDPMDEEDYPGWRALTAAIGKRALLVGDDLFTTSSKRLDYGIKSGLGNAILIKPNQIGTLSETLATARLATEKGYEVVTSHRSGETEDPSIAHLAVAISSYGLKAGSLSRSERLAKYNEILRIEESFSKRSKLLLYATAY